MNDLVGTLLFGLFAAVFFGFGVFLLFASRRLGQDIALMAAVATSRAADVRRLAPGTAVEVKGVIRCAEPLKGPFSERACVYAKTTVEKRVSEWEDGRRKETWRDESEAEQRIPFEVEDASGRVRVDSEGAQVEAIQSHEREELGGGLLEAVAGLAGGPAANARRYRERILPPDIPVYVLGWVQPGGAIGRALAGASSQTFIVTHESEETRGRTSHQWMVMSLIGGIVCIAGSVGLAWLALR